MPSLRIQVNQGRRLVSIEEQPRRYNNNYGTWNRPTITRTAKSSSLIYSHFVQSRRQNQLHTSLRQRFSPIHKIAIHDNVFDSISRILFPISFLIFNVIYWINFLKK